MRVSYSNGPVADPHLPSIRISSNKQKTQMFTNIKLLDEGVILADAKTPVRRLNSAIVNCVEMANLQFFL